MCSFNLNESWETLHGVLPSKGHRLCVYDWITDYLVLMLNHSKGLPSLGQTHNPYLCTFGFIWEWIFCHLMFVWNFSRTTQHDTVFECCFFSLHYHFILDWLSFQLAFPLQCFEGEVRLQFIIMKNVFRPLLPYSQKLWTKLKIKWADTLWEWVSISTKKRVCSVCAILR